MDSIDHINVPKIAKSIEAYFTLKTVKQLARCACPQYYGIGPYDYPDWTEDYDVKIKIVVSETIPAKIKDLEQYPDDDDYLCFHYKESDESENIIYTTDLDAVKMILSLVESLYEHEERSIHQSWDYPYKDDDLDSAYNRFSRRMHFTIDENEETGEMFLKMVFWSC
ncbi:MAG: hypothetical protein IK020_12835 [Clostridiales bacterium]|nr:hypothetical protein [Clostridiales bacterium]